MRDLSSVLKNGEAITATAINQLELLLRFFPPVLLLINRFNKQWVLSNCDSLVTFFQLKGDRSLLIKLYELCPELSKAPCGIPLYPPPLQFSPVFSFFSFSFCTIFDFLFPWFSPAKGSLGLSLSLGFDIVLGTRQGGTPFS